MEKQIETLNDDDAHIAKHAIEYHGLTLKQFVLMCKEADKRYEGQFSSAVDKVLAVECFYEGFKVACKEALAQAEKQEWQSLSDDEIQNLSHNNKCWMNAGENLIFDWEYFARAIEQALKEKNHG